MQMNDCVAKEAKRRLTASIRATGAVAVGYAEATAVSQEESDAFDRWLGDGNHASMEWLTRHRELRRDPRLLLDGARTVISIAYPYFQPRRRDPRLPQIAMYAYGKDYHDVLRKRLRPVCREMEEAYGCATRICVDSAPIAERYWAMRAGIGRRGDNGAVIVDGHGSFVFLCEILTTLGLPPDEPSTLECLHCGRCRSACPGKAILGDGTIRSPRCLSYLTIEHRDEFPAEGETADALRSPAGLGTLYGCDLCQAACPYNSGLDGSATLPEFLPRDGRILTLDAAQASAMTDEEWRVLNTASAMRRAKPPMLRRNALRLRMCKDLYDQ